MECGWVWSPPTRWSSSALAGCGAFVRVAIVSPDLLLLPALLAALRAPASAPLGALASALSRALASALLAGLALAGSAILAGLALAGRSGSVICVLRSRTSGQ